MGTEKNNSSNSNDSEQDENGSLDSISSQKINKNETEHVHNKTMTESAIGNAGTLIFDSYDEDILFRDAYDSPKANNEINMFQKRPSIELKEEKEKEKEKENENGDYVQTSPMTNDSHSVSSNKPMLNHNNIETKEIETNYNKPQKTRPSTTPSPIY